MIRLGIGIVAAAIVAAATLFLGYQMGSSGGTKTTPVAFSLSEMKLTDETSYVRSVVTSVIEGEESYLFGTLKTKRTMLAVADCRFGIDYKKHPLQASISGRSVIVRVIEPYNLGCEPSLAKSRFIEGGGLIPATADMYNSLGVKASEEIGREAVKMGFPDQAMQSATMSLENLFRKAGFEQVKVVFFKP